MNPGLPKITTLSSSTQHIQQAHTPTSNPSSYPKLNGVIPSIEEVLSGLSQPPYTRNHFLQYLLQRHCLENLEFYIEIERFLQLTDSLEKEYNWKFLYNHFIEVDSPKEINLPCLVRTHFSLDLVPTSKDLRDASKVVFDYLHENFVGFVSSNESNYCLSAPVPVRNDKVNLIQYQSDQEQKRQFRQFTYFDNQGRCISPLSPSESTRTTPIHRPMSLSDDHDFPFEMSDDDDDAMIDVEASGNSSHEKLTSNPILEESISSFNSNEDESFVSHGTRNLSVSSSHSNRFNIVGSFKAGGEGNWKKLAKKFKWRRSSNSSNE